MNQFCYTIFGLYGLTLLTAAVAEEQKLDLGIVEVVGVTPLSGAGVAIDKIPANIQTVTSEQLEDTQSISLADYLNRYLGSVHVNEAQNNPLQPDIYYRGFVASPLPTCIFRTT